MLSWGRLVSLLGGCPLVLKPSVDGLGLPEAMVTMDVGITGKLIRQI